MLSGVECCCLWLCCRRGSRYHCVSLCVVGGCVLLFVCGCPLVVRCLLLCRVSVSVFVCLFVRLFVLFFLCDCLLVALCVCVCVCVCLVVRVRVLCVWV